MMDPFFEFFTRERFSISQGLYSDNISVYKEYPRFQKINLPDPKSISMNIGDVLRQRASTKDFVDTPLTLLDISTILFFSAGLLENKRTADPGRRMHPSGGAKYPIEIYPIILKGKSVDSGIYHYNIKDHSLEKLRENGVDEIVLCFQSESFASSVGMLLIFSFMKERSIPKYGALGYKLGLIEGGHIGQNIYLISTALGLGCRAMGTGNNIEKLNALLDLDGINECCFYTVTVGVPRDSGG